MEAAVGGRPRPHRAWYTGPQLRRARQGAGRFDWEDARVVGLTANGELGQLHFWDDCRTGRYERLIADAAPRTLLPRVAGAGGTFTK